MSEIVLLSRSGSYTYMYWLNKINAILVHVQYMYCETANNSP